MIWIDYVIVAVVAVSALVSLWRGFVREVLSLAAWGLALWVGLAFSDEVAGLLSGVVALPSARAALAFLGLFLATLILGGWVNFLIGRLVDRTGLSGTDRLLGALFGAARGVVLVAALVLLAGLTPLPQDPWWRDSALIGPFQDLALWLRQYLPRDIAANFRFP
ncbi:CvpA family protein [Inmirania thermothiophila]|uniref:Membrane protein required for colicin V production n=1 Tax=Inmirania thermothiophila TaxID=1750597 RepID=A0A3N1Y2G3_9GAMM|nr:CvpA family protein [Inmirania thermothiophila]ROR32721.1 membrane protein required for colicin V production [Inmirania thermothiophila]